MFVHETTCVPAHVQLNDKEDGRKAEVRHVCFSGSRKHESMPAEGLNLLPLCHCEWIRRRGTAGFFLMYFVASINERASMLVEVAHGHIE